MNTTFTIPQLLDETNREAQEELHILAMQALDWNELRFEVERFGTFGSCRILIGYILTEEEAPPLDHNLAGKVRETLTEEDLNIFVLRLSNVIGKTYPRNDSTIFAWDFLNSTPTQQIVCALIAKGILK